MSQNKLTTVGLYFWRLIKFGILFGLIILPQFALLLPSYLPKNYSAMTRTAIAWLFFSLAYVLALFCLFQQFKPRKLASIKGKATNDVIVGFIIFFIIKLVYGFLSNVQTTQNDAALTKMFSLSPSAMLMMTIMTVFMAPLCEELLFRGLFMQYFFQKNRFLAIFFSGAIFGAIHFHSGDTFTTLLLYMSFGWVLAYYYKKSDNLLVPITIHFLNNLPAALIILISNLI